MREIVKRETIAGAGARREGAERGGNLLDLCAAWRAGTGGSLTRKRGQKGGVALRGGTL